MPVGTFSGFETAPTYFKINKQKSKNKRRGRPTTGAPHLWSLRVNDGHRRCGSCPTAGLKLHRKQSAGRVPCHAAAQTPPALKLHSHAAGLCSGGARASSGGAMPCPAATRRGRGVWAVHAETFKLKERLSGPHRDLCAKF
jgi:hypothetical protein